MDDGDLFHHFDVLSPNDQLQQKLEDTLRQNNMYQTQDALLQREAVLAKLNELLNQWMQDTVNSNKSKNVLDRSVNGRVLTFGSYRMGVHTEGADVDVLCIMPRCIKREDFFGSFREFLQCQQGIKDLTSIGQAFVPIMKMTFDSIKLDILFASLDVDIIPSNEDLRNESLLKNLPLPCVRSLNGYCVTDELLRLVPNKETFCIALRAIKLWAKNRGIYSNTVGFLGGVSWAMLVVKICQLHPTDPPFVVVQQFFVVFSDWKWPEPVLLKPMAERNPYNFPVWNPAVDSYHSDQLMPIITPVYPQQTSTFNVTRSSRRIITNELQAGCQIIENIIAGQADWDSLFVPVDFFTKYRHYLVLRTMAPSRHDQLRWDGLVESKIRLLIGFLDMHSSVVVAHVNPTCYQASSFPCGRTERMMSQWFIGMEFRRNGATSVDLTTCIQNFTTIVYDKANDIFCHGMAIEIKHVRRSDLFLYLTDVELGTARSSSASCLSTFVSSSCATMRTHSVSECNLPSNISNRLQPRQAENTANNQAKNAENTKAKRAHSPSTGHCLPSSPKRYKDVVAAMQSHKRTSAGELPDVISPEPAKYPCISKFSLRLMTKPRSQSIDVSAMHGVCNC